MDARDNRFYRQREETFQNEMSDQDFLVYCEMHSHTPRCGFVPSSLAKLCRLAGRTEWAEFWDDQANRVIDCAPDEIRRAVAEARLLIPAASPPTEG